MRKLLLLIFFVTACDYNLGPTIINTNTNTNTNNNDFHDLINFAPSTNPSAPVASPTGGTETPLPLPANAQGIAQTISNNNPTLIMRSCQAIYGESAWQFMDTIVAALKASDPRWGYMVKATRQISADVIAYRATSDNTGAWGVDIIVDLCGTPRFSWQVLGFDPNAEWSGTRF